MLTVGDQGTLDWQGPRFHGLTREVLQIGFDRSRFGLTDRASVPRIHPLMAPEPSLGQGPTLGQWN